MERRSTPYLIFYYWMRNSSHFLKAITTGTSKALPHTLWGGPVTVASPKTYMCSGWWDTKSTGISMICQVSMLWTTGSWTADLWVHLQGCNIWMLNAIKGDTWAKCRAGNKGKKWSFVIKVQRTEDKTTIFHKYIHSTLLLYPPRNYTAASQGLIWILLIIYGHFLKKEETL